MEHSLQNQVRRLRAAGYPDGLEYGKNAGSKPQLEEPQLEEPRRGSAVIPYARQVSHKRAAAHGGVRVVFSVPRLVVCATP